MLGERSLRLDTLSVDGDQPSCRPTCGVVARVLVLVHVQEPRDSVSHVEQHDLQRVSVHPFLIGRGSVVRVVHLTIIFGTILQQNVTLETFTVNLSAPPPPSPLLFHQAYHHLRVFVHITCIRPNNLPLHPLIYTICGQFATKEIFISS